MTNNTGSPITFTSIVVKGVSPAANTDFAKSSDGCSPSVAAGQACMVNVTFTPSVAAVESATLVITAMVTSGGQSSTEVFNVNLTGTGSATAPGVEFDHTTVAFANQSLNTTSAAIPVKLTNTGLGPLTINSIAASGDFGQTNTCPVSPATLAAGGACTIDVTFTPTALGARKGTLTVTDNATGSPQTIPLTGTGVAAAGVGFDHMTVSFSGQMVTTTSAATPVMLTNTGTGALTINSIVASGDFAQTNTCPVSPATLAAAGTCMINVTFAPTATGARTGTLTVTDNAAGSPQSIPLTGTGWDFQVTAPASETGKSTITFNATLTPLGGFNQSVAFTCTAPSGTTCTVVTPVTTTDGKTAQPVAVGVTRTSNGMAVPPPPVYIPPISVWQFVPLLLAALLLFLVPKTKELRLRLGLATAVVLLIALAGCSSGSKPPITGNVTITGTSSGSAGSVSHSATVAVTVN